jgi:hypothetical protein
MNSNLYICIFNYSLNINDCFSFTPYGCCYFTFLDCRPKAYYDNLMYSLNNLNPVCDARNISKSYESTYGYDYDSFSNALLSKFMIIGKFIYIILKKNQ